MSKRIERLHLFTSDILVMYDGPVKQPQHMTAYVCANDPTADPTLLCYVLHTVGTSVTAGIGLPLCFICLRHVATWTCFAGHISLDLVLRGDWALSA
jgi:hypothetical protein